MIIKPEYTKCPKCEALYSYSEKIPENTSGAEVWSDGFCMAPLRKDIFGFAKCPACNSFFWLKENSLQLPTGSPAIKNLENLLSIDNIGSKEIDFIKDAFRSGLAKATEKEIALRTTLWHVINHIIRKHDSQGILKKIRQIFSETANIKDSQKQYHSFSSLKLNNLIRLANLLKLDIENTNYLLFAEIYRELGDFSKAMIFCHRAETSLHIDSNRITLLKQHIKNKSKIAYKL